MSGYMLHLAQEENIVLGAGIVRRLIEGGDGDAALLYLCLARRGSSEPERLRAELRWDAARFAAAERALNAMGLIKAPPGAPAPADGGADATGRAEPASRREGSSAHETAKPPAGQGTTAQEAAKPSPARTDAGAGGQAEPARRAAPPPETALPEYSREDVMNKLEDDASFAAVLAEAERKLGRLSDPSVRKLLGLYDYLGLPADVVLLLVNYCIERKAEQFGEGRLPTMREIEREGYAWARLELFSFAAADAYLIRERKKRGRFPAYMAALRLEGRAPVPGEERYLGAWSEWGFPPETVAIAYDKTILRCQELKWPYLNGILKKWHEKGLHTPDEVNAEDAAARGGAAARKSAGKNAWMKNYD